MVPGPCMPSSLVSNVRYHSRNAELIFTPACCCWLISLWAFDLTGHHYVEDCGENVCSCVLLLIDFLWAFDLIGRHCVEDCGENVCSCVLLLIDFSLSFRSCRLPLCRGSCLLPRAVADWFLSELSILNIGCHYVEDHGEPGLRTATWGNLQWVKICSLLS